MQMVLAYQTAAFTRADKLKPLDDYLKMIRPKRKYESWEIAAAFDQSNKVRN